MNASRKTPVIAAGKPGPEIAGETVPTDLRKSAFGDTYQEWIAAQREIVERIGVFGEDLRPW